MRFFFYKISKFGIFTEKVHFFEGMKNYLGSFIGLVIDDGRLNYTFFFPNEATNAISTYSYPELKDRIDDPLESSSVPLDRML